MNAVVVAVALMLVLSLCRVHVVVALIVGAMAGGLLGGLSIHETLGAFQSGLGGGATVALSYALLGAFAVAIGKSGVADALANRILALIGKQNPQQAKGYLIDNQTEPITHINNGSIDSLSWSSIKYKTDRIFFITY